MKIEIVDINTIKPYENNPRKLKDSAIEKVAKSIKEFGFRQPIVVDKEKIIVVGHTRYRASKKLGLTNVPITIADNLTPEQINAYRIADNRTNEEAEWDIELLKTELKDLQLKDFDLDLTAFDEDQLNNFLFEEKEGLTDEDAVPETPEEPITKLGDIWKLGNHRLMCGDSTLINNFDKLCLEQADMIFTDPPYGMSYGGGRAEGSTPKGALVKAHGMIKNDDLRDEELINLVKDSLSTSLMKSKQGSASYICFTWRTYSEFYKALTDAGFKIKNCIVWDKKSIGLGLSHYRPQHEFIFYCGEQWYGDKSQSDVWYMSRGATSKYVHPTQKPVELICKALENSSKNEDVIIDCFGGSGSTLIACEKLNRKARVMELDPKYCDVIVKRWEQFTGKKAELENGQN
jgi:site-specific DNA-methyltransferase (adenine-specific)